MENWYQLKMLQNVWYYDTLTRATRIRRTRRQRPRPVAFVGHFRGGDFLRTKNQCRTVSGTSNYCYGKAGKAAYLVARVQRRRERNFFAVCRHYDAIDIQLILDETWRSPDGRELWHSRALPSRRKPSMRD